MLFWGCCFFHFGNIHSVFVLCKSYSFLCIETIMNAQEIRHVKCSKGASLANSYLSQISVENMHVYNYLDISLNDTPDMLIV